MADGRTLDNYESRSERANSDEVKEARAVFDKAAVAERPGCEGAYQPVNVVPTRTAGEYHCAVCDAHVSAYPSGGGVHKAQPHERKAV